MEWKSFELRPEGVEVPPKTPEYMERARAGVERLSQDYGIDMKWNSNSKHSRKAHEGAKYAEHQGKSNEFQEAVLVAQFQMNRDINDLDVLTDIARSIGLDTNAFRQSVEQHEFEHEVIADEEIAYQIGVTGIPCFIVENRGVMGVQSKEDLIALLDGSEM